MAGAQRLDPGVTRRVVAEEDVRGAIPKEVPDSDRGVRRIGSGDTVPAGDAAVADGLEPGVAARTVAEQDVVGTVSEEVGNSHHAKMRIGAADLVPAGK